MRFVANTNRLVQHGYWRCCDREQHPRATDNTETGVCEALLMTAGQWQHRRRSFCALAKPRQLHYGCRFLFFYNALVNNTVDYNTAVGAYAPPLQQYKWSTQHGRWNNALLNNTTGDGNTAMGYNTRLSDEHHW